LSSVPTATGFSPGTELLRNSKLPYKQKEGKKRNERKEKKKGEEKGEKKNKK
jgi:hypothetical protein